MTTAAGTRTTSTTRAPGGPTAGWGTTRTVLRLHRAALLLWALTVTGLVAGLVWLTEVTADEARARQRACERAVQDWCDTTFDVGHVGDVSEPLTWIGLVTCFSYVAVAAFAGGALIGRDLENGTARLAWTQGVSPARWLTAKLAVPALAVTAGTTVLVMAFRWAWEANLDLTYDEWMYGEAYLARGTTAVAYALCALALGTLAAFLLRRALPALGAAVAASGLLHFVLDRYRGSLWPAVTRTLPVDHDTLPENAWQVDYGVLVNGRPAPDAKPWTCEGSAAETQRCLDDMGVTGFFSTFHPESHYWPLQLVESGIVLAVAALAATASFLLLRRRTA
ncbi:hypothetical protein [Streptomyces sp. A012304]|uniref:hypothetical protein n=1 Tax=Streptomyces sp. A012304 TaxID=375446 RepID=UPI00223083EA|nr:hypothetical protein [Streptomyces sp. A012304]GKQ36945.1 hypothetical protein ALMP_34850 [Streptomyces sp. A012304]